MINKEVLEKYTKYSHRYCHFSKEDCDRIKDTGEKPYGWCELLSDEYGNQTTADAFEPKVLNALNEGRGILLNKNKRNHLVLTPVTPKETEKERSKRRRLEKKTAEKPKQNNQINDHSIDFNKMTVIQLKEELNKRQRQSLESANKNNKGLDDLINVE